MQTLGEFERLLSTVADAVNAPDYFPVQMPENDLHPEPAALQAQIVSLRYRVEALEKRFAGISGLSNDGNASR